MTSYIIKAAPNIRETEEQKENRLAPYIQITKISNEIENPDHWMGETYNTVQEALDKLENPKCSKCSHKFKENDKIYLKNLDNAPKPFHNKPKLCHNCKKNQLTAEKI